MYVLFNPESVIKQINNYNTAIIRNVKGLTTFIYLPCSYKITSHNVKTSKHKTQLTHVNCELRPQTMLLNVEVNNV